ncbi:MAG: antibiotic biosynthesis monooxygenase [Actinomycetota bacterium]|nr:antibiotic biosynthesis monooxygenase [Actinomycetota bacterium]
MARVQTAVTMRLARKDLDEVIEIFATLIRGVRENDYGVLTYHYYIDEDPLRIHVFEQYVSSEAHLDHFSKIDQAAVGRLLELVELSDLHYYGTPSQAELELLSGFGNVHYHPLLLSFDD